MAKADAHLFSVFDVAYSDDMYLGRNTCARFGIWEYNHRVRIAGVVEQSNGGRDDQSDRRQRSGGQSDGVGGKLKNGDVSTRGQGVDRESATHARQQIDELSWRVDTKRRQVGWGRQSEIPHERVGEMHVGFSRGRREREPVYAIISKHRKPEVVKFVRAYEIAWRPPPGPTVRKHSQKGSLNDRPVDVRTQLL